MYRTILQKALQSINGGVMRAAVFLDRDGTINIEKNYLYRREDFQYIDGATKALHHLSRIGFTLIIISNQSGIARGFYTEEDYCKLNDWMIEDLKSRGIMIAGTYYCPHHPDSKIKKYRVYCDCRKPEIGLFQQAMLEHDIDVKSSFAVGDKLRDLSICKEYPIQGILLGDCIMSELDFQKIQKEYQKPLWKCHNLYEAAKMIDPKFITS